MVTSPLPHRGTQSRKETVGFLPPQSLAPAASESIEPEGDS